MTMILNDFPVLHLASLLGREILAGRLAGFSDRAQLAPRIADDPPLAILHFGEVRALTPSYFATGLAPLWVELQCSIAAVGLPDIRDDLETCLSLHRLALWDLDGSPEPLGELDDTAHAALDLCLAHGEVTAASLARKNPAVKPTAWSNRLASLHAKRLLNRQSSGREVLYSLPWNDKEYASNGN